MFVGLPVHFVSVLLLCGWDIHALAGRKGISATVRSFHSSRVYVLAICVFHVLREYVHVHVRVCAHIRVYRCFAFE